MLRLTMLALAGLPLLAQPPAVDKVMQEFVRSFNAGEDAMRAFYEQHATADPPVEERMGRYRQHREKFGTLALQDISVDKPQPATAVFTGSTGIRVTMEFEFTAGAAPKLAGQRVRVGGPRGKGRPGPAGPSGPPLSEGQAIKEIEAAIARRGRADEFSGVVLVARGDEVLLEGATGYFNRNAEAPNRPDILFSVGSIVKTMTKVCIGRLWAERKLSLDDTIGRFLPDYPNREAATSVTIRHLLTMTSGMGDFHGPKFTAVPKADIKGLSDYLPYFASEPLAFKPGTSQKYSNSGYLVLGLIIEKVTGKSYYDFVAETVFQPLGMKDSGFYERDDPRPRLATGYTRSEPGAPRRDNMYILSRRGTSAGGAYSTVRDLLRFARALQTKKLEPANAPEELRQGEGFTIGGGANGVNATIMCGIPGSYIVIALANYDPPAASDMAGEAAGVLRRIPRRPGQGGAEGRVRIRK